MGRINDTYEESKFSEGLTLLIIFTDNRKAIEVIDNRFIWEEDNYDRFGTRTFCDLEDAIELAKKVADKLGIRYDPFESRYFSFRECDYVDINMTISEMDELIEKFEN